MLIFNQSLIGWAVPLFADRLVPLADDQVVPLTANGVVPLADDKVVPLGC